MACRCPGCAVSFAALTGGGSTDSATVISDGAGLASMGVTLGAAEGGQSFSASAPGLSPISFTATGTASAAKTWTGAVNGSWTTAGNWSPAAVPVAGDSVVLPASAANAPQLTRQCNDPRPDAARRRCRARRGRQSHRERVGGVAR